MPKSVYRLLLSLVFPDGISPGEGREGNHLILARDGARRPVLRGTALAGALRHGWMDMLGMDRECAEEWFGRALDGELGGVESPLRVPDCVLEPGAGNHGYVRTHIAVDRHRGSVLEGGLFSLEALPPGTITSACLWLDETKEMKEPPREFLQELVAVLARGMTLGGNASRGIGRVALNGVALFKQFDLSDLGQHSAYLDERHAWARGQMPTAGEPLEASAGDMDASDQLRIEFCLGIPRGEDILVADGQGFDYEMEPQRVRCADGQTRWRIPGSTLRGAIRAWCTRLAARAGENVADSLERWRQRDGEINGDMLAHGYDDGDRPEETRALLEKRGAAEKLAERVPCPIMRLFGSAYSKSRIHVSDALSEQPPEPAEEQVRAHVAVDRITGGAQEGAFFQNTVLTGRQRFSCVITVREPEEKEVKWLYAALRAIDLGIIRIGSSKAGGRLALAERPKVKGMCPEIFNSLNTSEE